jgi:hypothetical protein
MTVHDDATSSMGARAGDQVLDDDRFGQLIHAVDAAVALLAEDKA